MQRGDRAPAENTGGGRIEGLNQHFLTQPLFRGALGTLALFNIVGGSAVIVLGNHESINVPAEATAEATLDNAKPQLADVEHQDGQAGAIKPVPVTKPRTQPTTVATSKPYAPPVTPKPRTQPTTVATSKPYAPPVTTEIIKTKPVPPAKTCNQLVNEVRNIAPPPKGWRIICEGRHKHLDGATRAGTISIYFGDPEDTEDYSRYVILHETGHAYQKSAGTDSTFSNAELENQADDFACAFGYCYHSGDRRGAVAICQMLAVRHHRVC